VRKEHEQREDGKWEAESGKEQGETRQEKGDRKRDTSDYLLESCRDGNNLLDGRSQPFDIVLPVEDVTNIETGRGGHLQPPPQVVPPHRFVRLEDRSRHCSFRHLQQAA
jgi:hypothetical protein